MQARHILLTTDLSEESRRIFPAARALAKTDGARITLLYVLPDLVVTPHGAPFAPPIGSAGLAEQTDAARVEIERLSQELGSKAEAVVIPGNDVAREVCRYAAENGCDLIVASTHGRTGFRRLMLGSVAEGILRNSTVPVLCIPRQE